MRGIICLALFVFVSQLTFSQSATISYTKGLRYAKKYFVRNIIEDAENGFYSIIIPNSKKYSSSDYVYIDHLDSSMNRVSHKILNLKEGKSRLRYEYLLEKDDQMWLFCSYSHRKLKKNYLYLQELDKSTLERKGELKKITEIDYLSHKSPGQFHFTYSSVGNDFLVFAQRPKSNVAGLQVEMLVLSDDLIVKEKQSLQWGTEIGNLKFKNVFYDGGKLAFFARQLISQEYVFYHRENRADKLTKTVVTANGNSISDIEAFWNKGKITCHGLYKQTLDGAVSGVFKVDFKNEKLEGYQEDPLFTEQKKLYSPSVNHDVWKKLTLKKIVNRGKGLVLLVCEQSNDFTVTYQTYNQSPYYGGGYYGGYGGGYYGGYGHGGCYYSTETVDYDSYNHVVLIAVQDGKEVWRKLVPKKQSLEKSLSYWGSVAINSNESGLFLYFNSTTETTASEDGVNEFTGGKHYALTEVKVDDKGTMTRMNVYKGASNTREIPVISSFYFSRNSMIFQGRKGTQTRFYKLNY